MDSIVVVCGCVVRVMEDGWVEYLWKEDDGCLFVMLLRFVAGRVV